MNIVVIGVGYVGLVTGLSLVKLGNKVTFLDTDWASQLKEELDIEDE